MLESELTYDCVKDICSLKRKEREKNINYQEFIDENDSLSICDEIFESSDSDSSYILSEEESCSVNTKKKRKLTEKYSEQNYNHYINKPKYPKDVIQRKMIRKVNNGIYTCSVIGCDYSCNRKQTLSAHKSRTHRKTIYRCAFCGKRYRLSDSRLKHIQRHHKEKNQPKTNNLENNLSLSKTKLNKNLNKNKKLINENSKLNVGEILYKKGKTKKEKLFMKKELKTSKDSDLEVQIPLILENYSLNSSLEENLNIKPSIMLNIESFLI